MTVSTQIRFYSLLFLFAYFSWFEWPYVEAQAFPRSSDSKSTSTIAAPWKTEANVARAGAVHLRLPLYQSIGILKGETPSKQVLGLVRQQTEKLLQSTLLDNLGLSFLSDFHLHYSQTLPRPHGGKHVYLQYQQTSSNRHVPIVGTWLKIIVAISNTGISLISLDSQLYPELKRANFDKNSDSRVNIMKRGLLELDLKDSAYTPASFSEQIRYINSQWRLVNVIEFWERAGTTAVVESRINGSTWHYDSSLHQNVPFSQPQPAYTGTVRGRYILYDPVLTGNQLFKGPLPFLKIFSPLSGTTFADQRGNFSFPAANQTQTIGARLTGRLATVLTLQGTDLFAATQASSRTPVQLLFNPNGNAEFDTAQVNAYVHITKTLTWVLSRLGINPSTMDIPLFSEVNVNNACNAAYYPGVVKVAFYGAGQLPSAPFTCINSAFDEVVSHEVGHYLDDVFGGISLDALIEGICDTIANYIYDTPSYGNNFTSPPSILARSALSNVPYPPDLTGGGTHFDGQSVSSFAWRLRELLSQAYGSAGVRLAEDFLVSAIAANVSTIPEYVWHTVLLDDDDTDLTNGTPNLTKIVQAASGPQLHPFLGLEAVADIESPLNGERVDAHQQPIVSINGTADVSALGLSFSEYRLYYGEGAPATQWHLISRHTGGPVQSNRLGTWDLTNIPTGVYTLKLVVDSTTPGMSFAYQLAFAIDNTTTTPIAINPNRKYSLTFDGQKAVWVEESAGGSYEIFVKDLQTNLQSTYVSTNNRIYKAVASFPFIAWEEERSGNKEIILYDERLQREVFQTTNPSNQSNPSLSSSFLVWEDRRSGDSDIMALDLATLRSFLVATGTEEQLAPNLSGKSVVWEQSDAGNYEIYYANLITGSSQQITSNIFDDRAPSIDGNIIAWQRRLTGRASTGAIWYYNLATGQEISVTPFFGLEETPPIVKGNRIYWIDGRYYFLLLDPFNLSYPRDIFYYDINTIKLGMITADSSKELEYSVGSSSVALINDSQQPFVATDIFLSTP